MFKIFIDHRDGDGHERIGYIRTSVNPFDTATAEEALIALTERHPDIYDSEDKFYVQEDNGDLIPYRLKWRPATFEAVQVG